MSEFHNPYKKLRRKLNTKWAKNCWSQFFKPLQRGLRKLEYFHNPLHPLEPLSWQRAGVDTLLGRENYPWVVFGGSLIGSFGVLGTLVVSIRTLAVIPTTIPPPLVGCLIRIGSRFATMLREIGLRFGRWVGITWGSLFTLLATFWLIFLPFGELVVGRKMFRHGLGPPLPLGVRKRRPIG